MYYSHKYTSHKVPHLFKNFLITEIYYYTLINTLVCTDIYCVDGLTKYMINQYLKQYPIQYSQSFPFVSTSILVTISTGGGGEGVAVVGIAHQDNTLENTVKNISNVWHGLAGIADKTSASL